MSLVDFDALDGVNHTLDGLRLPSSHSTYSPPLSPRRHPLHGGGFLLPPSVLGYYASPAEPALIDFGANAHGAFYAASPFRADSVAAHALHQRMRGRPASVACELFDENARDGAFPSDASVLA